MRIYPLDAVRPVSGADAVEVVEQMRLGSVDPAPDRTTYMVQVADRAEFWNGHLIDCSSEETFLTDLERAGLIKIAREEQ